MLGGEVVADTTAPLLVWEVPYFPTYYFPPGDVRTDFLSPIGEVKRSPSRGDATQYAVEVGDSSGAAYAFHDSKIPECVDHYVFVWRTMDQWFEEDEEVFVQSAGPLHPSQHPALESPGPSGDRRRHRGRQHQRALPL